MASSSYKITLVSIGSRGDIQPYINLGCFLKLRGHDVSFAAEERLRPLVESHGLPWKLIKGDKGGWILMPEVEKAIVDGEMFKLIKLQEELDKRTNKQEILDSYIPALSGADIVITGGLSLGESLTACEYLKTKTWLPLILGPTLPTSEFPLWAMKSIACCSCMNKWTYNVAFNAQWGSEKKFIEPWRSTLGLPSQGDGYAQIIEKRRLPIIMCCSEVFCGPRQRIPDDYAPHYGCLGFYFTPDEFDAKPEPELVEFLNTNTNIPIIYLGFGSMPAPNGPQQWIELAKNVLTSFPSGAVRILLLMGWNEMNAAMIDEMLNSEPYKGFIFVVKSVSHNFVFPYMDCIVHHCGFGTMAAALKSGKPQVPLAFYLDQPHNAQTVVNLGCAPGFLKFQTFTTQSLHAELNKVLFGPNKEKFAAAAAKMGQRIRDESATSLPRSCEIIEKFHATRELPVIHNEVLRSQASNSL